MKQLIEILLYIWQLPQNLLGMFLVWKLGKNHVIHSGSIMFVYSSAMKGSLALGQVVIINASQYRKQNALNRYTAKKAFGFAELSKWSGPLYLIVFGIPYLANKYFIHRELWFGERMARRIMNIK